MRLLPLILAAALGLFAPVAALRAESILAFAGDDSAMNAAMSDARANLQVFLDKAATSDLSQGDFLVKWAHPVEDDGGGVTRYEHIWVTVFALNDSFVTGAFANQPSAIPGLQGDPVTVPLAEVSDWSWWDSAGMLHGSYTTRVMVPQLPADDQAYFASILAPLP